MSEPSAGAPRAKKSTYYTFEAPGREFSIQLSVGAAERLLGEGVRGLGLIPRRGAEVGGVLAGSIIRGERTVIRIDEAVPVACEYAFGPSYVLSGNDKDAFRRALAEVGAVGFYRSDIRDSLAATASDLTTIREIFAEPDPVLLLLKPRMIEASIARCFVCGNGEPRRTNDVEFRPPSRQGGRAGVLEPPALETPALETPPPAEPPRDAPAPDIPLPSFLSVPARKPHKRFRLPRWYSWWIQAPLLIALLGADALLGYFAAVRIGGKARTDPYALSLEVKEYGDNLHLSWDREARAIASARRGVLTIVDGGSTRTIDLTSGQLRDGRVTYRRTTTDVRLELEVFVDESTTVSETWQPQPGAAPRPALPPQ